MKPTVGPDVKTVIGIRPHRWGWKTFEAPGVEAVFPKKDQAIDAAMIFAPADLVNVWRDAHGKISKALRNLK